MPPLDLPRPDDFRSARLTYRNGDLFNPPALTNFLGCLQAAPDLLAVQHVTFAPYSLGESWLGKLVLNDCCLHTTGETIDFEWRPDRIVRKLRHDGFDLESVVAMGVRRQTVCWTLRLTNAGLETRQARLRILAGEGVVHSTSGWKTPYSPRECPAISATPWDGTPPAHTLVRNRLEALPEGDALLFASRTSPAFALQAASPRPDGLDRRWFDFDLKLASGQTKELYFFLAVGGTREEVFEELKSWKAHPERAPQDAEADWAEELRAAFTPGNSRYSGHLPLLRTDNADLRAVWLNAVVTVIYFKREPPASRYGRTYVTLMPRYWATTSFINDWSLAAHLLVLLDPACVRQMLELWLARDIYNHFGTEYVSGESTGNWYSCNDYAIARLISAYVRVTGDRDWLGKEIAGRTILEHLRACALHYRKLDRGTGLADYGDRNSLLEAVGTYEHEVASLNAANVWILRETARLLDTSGEAGEAESLRAEAQALVPRIQTLYARGKGYWNCRHPDGALVPVRHVWDFVHTLNFLHEDLPQGQIEEMVAYFLREHRSPAWLSALSPLDEDTGFSLRPDHQWNGSYPAWVSLAGGALLKTGHAAQFAAWLPGLARTALQGPYSQAHFVETAAPSVEGGARKAPTEWPYINDWTCLAAGGFFDTILLELFGVDFGYKTLEARPKLTGLDPEARLENLRYRQGLYRVGADGVREQS